MKALIDAGITRFTTTHDAINVKKQDEAKARRVIQAAIKKQGLKMQLKTKKQALGTEEVENVKSITESPTAPVVSATSFATHDLMDVMQAKLEAQFIDDEPGLVESPFAEIYHNELETMTDEQRVVWTLAKLEATPTAEIEW